MATRNISPRADGEGSLGRSGKKWGNIYADNAHIAGRDIAEDGAKLDANSSAIDSLRNAVGSPLVANSVLDMTDTNKIYVYTGNETGYTKGDWYYWNGSAWVSGGVYNSTAFDTDKTLTVEGAAADAQVTGDWLRDIAVPVTALPEIPETAFANEYMKVVVDKDNRVLYGVKRDGTFTWAKGTPQHVIDACNPTIENPEYLYVMLDTEGHIILGVKRDGSVTWQKGTPQHVIEACNPTIDNPEYLYLIKDPDDRVIFAIKKDGSIDWQKGVPKPIQEKIFTDKIDSEEFVQLTQDSNGNLIEGITIDGTKKFMSPVKFNGNVIWGKNDAKGIGEALNASGYTAFDYKQYIKSIILGTTTVGLDVLYLNGDMTGISKDNKVDMTYRYLDKTGTCTLKWQGATSVNFPKKNYTMAKMSPGIDVGWGNHKKYVLKADFPDYCHARNIVAAKLWGEIVKSRIPVNTKLSALPNGGAIDGFPIMLVINGEYQGLYNFNIPKDPWMLNMGSGNSEAMITCEGGGASCEFKATVSREDILAARYWEIEYIPDEDSPDWAIGSFNRMLQACIGSTGSNYRSTLEDYLDIESAIDYYIHTCILGNADGINHNFIMCTYDGIKWFFNAYDLDHAFGTLGWSTVPLSPKSSTTFKSAQYSNRVFHLIYTYDKDALKARYRELRDDILSENNILMKMANYLVPIPKPVMDEDAKMWPTTPGTLTCNFSWVMDWYKLRVQYMDEEINNL